MIIFCVRFPPVYSSAYAGLKYVEKKKLVLHVRCALDYLDSVRCKSTYGLSKWKINSFYYGAGIGGGFIFPRGNTPSLDPHTSAPVPVPVPNRRFMSMLILEARCFLKKTLPIPALRDTGIMINFARFYINVTCV
jgi:hypothetical protein